MKNNFIEDIIESFEENIPEIHLCNQGYVKDILKNECSNFPMICFEFTQDCSVSDVSIDESKFLNDSTHDGNWIVGKNDDDVCFVLNLKETNGCIEIDAFEVNANMRYSGLGSFVVSVLEYIGKDYYDKIILKPFDMDASIFWNHMGYVEEKNGYWIKKINKNGE